MSYLRKLAYTEWTNHAVATWHSMVRIDDTHVLVAHSGSGADGFISSFSVSSTTGAVSHIATVEHDTADGTNNVLLAISSTHYILLYRTTSSKGKAKIFSVNLSTYAITEVSSFEFDSTYFGAQPSACLLGANHLITVYNTGYPGTVIAKVLTWNGSYTISTVSTTTLDANATNYGHTQVVLLDSTHIAASWCETGEDGRIEIWAFDANYALTESSTLEYDTVNGYYAALQKIDSTHLLIAYRGDGSDGFIKVITINESTYAMSAGTALEHDTIYGNWNSLIGIDANNYFLAFAGHTNRVPFVKHFRMGDSYAIEQVCMDMVSTSYTTCDYFSLIQLSSTMLLLVFASSNTTRFQAYSFSVSDVIKRVYKESQGINFEFNTSYGLWHSMAVLSPTLAVDHYRRITGSYAALIGIASDNELSLLSDTQVAGSVNITQCLKIDATRFIAAFGTTSDASRLISYSINTSTWEITALNNLQLGDTATIYDISKLVWLSSTHFALAHSDTQTSTGSGWVRIYSIDGSYAFTEVSSIKYVDAVQSRQNTICKAGTNKIAVAYRGAEDDGFIKIFSYNESYTLTELASVEWDPAYAQDMVIETYDNTYFVIVSRSTSPTMGRVSLLKYNGTDTISVLMHLVTNDVRGTTNDILRISATKMLTFTADTTYNLLIQVYTLDAANDSFYLEDSFYSFQGYYPGADWITSTKFIVGYGGPGDDGFVAMFEYDPSTGWIHAFNGVSNFAKLNAVELSAISKVSGV